MNKRFQIRHPEKLKTNQYLWQKASWIKVKAPSEASENKEDCKTK